MKSGPSKWNKCDHPNGSFLQWHFLTTQWNSWSMHFLGRKSANCMSKNPLEKSVCKNLKKYWEILPKQLHCIHLHCTLTPGWPLIDCNFVNNHTSLVYIHRIMFDCVIVHWIFTKVCTHNLYLDAIWAFDGEKILQAMHQSINEKNALLFTTQWIFYLPSFFSQNSLKMAWRIGTSLNLVKTNERRAMEKLHYKL